LLAAFAANRSYFFLRELCARLCALCVEKIIGTLDRPSKMYQLNPIPDVRADGGNSQSLTHFSHIFAIVLSMKSRSPEPGHALTDRIIRCAIKVHTGLGPGLPESIYRRCLCWELDNEGLAVEQEVPLALVYKGMRIDNSYKADVIVDHTVLIETKSVEAILPVHKAQALTYLRLTDCSIALLMNFNTVRLKDGLHRFIAGHRPDQPTKPSTPSDR